jgi:hypothetical protein
MWFAVHAAVVVWLTWPLAQHAGTDLPNTWVGCQFDLLQMGWALAHQAKALVTAPWALAEANIYHPTPHALLYGDPGFGALPWFMPVYLLTDNPILASNVTFLLSIALTAWTLHLVVHRWTHSHAGGFVAGWTFVTTPWVLWTWVPAAPNNAVLQYSPLIVLLASMPVLTARRLAVLLSLVILQGLTAIYVAIPMFLVLGVIALVRLLRGNRDTAFKLIVLAGIASLVLAVANAGFMLVRAENPNILWQTFWPPEETAPAELPWGLFTPIAPMRVHLAVLLLVVGGALSFVFERPHRLEETRGWQHAALWSAIALWASLPPRVTAFGHTVSIDAITLAGWLPFLRGAERLGPVGLIGLALLAGLAVPALGRRLSTFSSSTVAREWAPRVVALAVVVIIHRQYVSTTSNGAYPLSAAISASSSADGRAARRERPAARVAGSDTRPARSRDVSIDLSPPADLERIRWLLAGRFPRADGGRGAPSRPRCAPRASPPNRIDLRSRSRRRLWLEGT